jgi:tRNA pseudouridine38-40 synthase
MRIALGLEYDGATFCGWQTQPSGCGVQDAVETALAGIASQGINTVCAGRTDAGVHALCQVVHFDCETIRPQSAWTRGVNAALRTGISVLWEREVSGEFHARYSATARHYKYFLLNRDQRPGLFSSHLGWFDAKLDADAMHEAGLALKGEHDFSAFRAAECQARNPVRTIHELTVSRQGDIICFEIAANAFLQHMVRNIVGSLVYVGCGRQRSGWIGELLESRDRRRAAPTFAASGLYMSAVDYEDHWQLPGVTSDALPDAVLAALK